MCQITSSFKQNCFIIYYNPKQIKGYRWITNKDTSEVNDYQKQFSVKFHIDEPCPAQIENFELAKWNVRNMVGIYVKKEDIPIYHKEESKRIWYLF